MASDYLHEIMQGLGHHGVSLFESGQIPSSLLGAQCIGRHEPGTRRCGERVQALVVKAVRPHAEYGAVEVPARQCSVTQPQKETPRDD